MSLGPNGIHSVRHGNRGATYDSSGRLLLTGVRRGNVLYAHDARGRLVGKTIYRADGSFNMYDAKGRYIGQSARQQ
jgi:YD repeat-containing protein